MGKGSGKSWIFRFMLRGRAREMGLGSFRLMSLAEARENAWKYRKMVSQGIDPIETRRAERKADNNREQESLVTFKTFAESYIDRNKAAWKGPQHAKEWRSILSNHAYPLLPLGNPEMERADVDRLEAPHPQARQAGTP
ncbi:MAG: DUF4102 domain-containing protein [Acidobacteria bacterium]|nr:DUF4102 domain-containing protein [Acidobacteriota bacterium]